jgi:hypothetical protein
MLARVTQPMDKLLLSRSPHKLFKSVERERAGKRDGERKRERDRDRDGERQREGKKERERQIEGEGERERQREGEREREGVYCIAFSNGSFKRVPWHLLVI